MSKETEEGKTEVNVNVDPSTDHSKEAHRTREEPKEPTTVEVNDGDTSVTVTEGE